MATITTRAGKGAPLTNTEVDSNFTNLNTDKVETSTSITAGTGLTGGGDLSTDRSIALDVSGVTSGTYGSASSVPVLTVDDYGRITVASTAAPTLDTITSNGGTTSNAVTVGDLTANNFTFAAQGVGVPSTLTFAAYSDSAKIEVVSPESDKVEYKFLMSDNPDSLHDKFLWKIESWKGDHADWQPLLLTGIDVTFTGDQIKYDGRLEVALDPFYNDGVNKNQYLQLNGAPALLNVNTSGFTGTSRQEFCFRVNASLDIQVYINQGGTYIDNQTATVSQTITPTGSGQDVGWGVSVSFPTAGLVEGMKWAFSVYRAGGIFTDSGNEYFHEGNLGDVTFNSTGAITLPSGTTAQQPSTPVTGMIRYNSELDTFEGYTTAEGWGEIAGGGGLSEATDDLVIVGNVAGAGATYQELTMADLKSNFGINQTYIQSGQPADWVVGDAWIKV